VFKIYTNETDFCKSLSWKSGTRRINGTNS